MMPHGGRDITGLILAGGRGARMGGADKGLADFRGRPLIDVVIERLAPQVDRILINANRNSDAYRACGCEVIADADPASFSGPLAGLRAGLAACATPWLAAVPCDVPGFPRDLVARLQAGLAGADAAYAVTDSGAHPVFLLCRRELLDPLDAWLADGHRRMTAWLATVQARTVRFDDEAAFTNLNTPQDWSTAGAG